MADRTSPDAASSAEAAEYKMEDATPIPTLFQRRSCSDVNFRVRTPLVLRYIADCQAIAPATGRSSTPDLESQGSESVFSRTDSISSFGSHWADSDILGAPNVPVYLGSMRTEPQPTTVEPPYADRKTTQIHWRLPASRPFAPTVLPTSQMFNKPHPYRARALPSMESKRTVTGSSPGPGQSPPDLPSVVKNAKRQQTFPLGRTPPSAGEPMVFAHRKNSAPPGTLFSLDHPCMAQKTFLNGVDADPIGSSNHPGEVGYVTKPLEAGIWNTDALRAPVNFRAGIVKVEDEPLYTTSLSHLAWEDPEDVSDDESPLDMDSIYDNLLEGVSNTISRIVGDAGLLKLKCPVEDYIHDFLQCMLNDALPCDSIHEDENEEQACDSGSHLLCRPGDSLTEGTRKRGTSSNGTSKRKRTHGQTTTHQTQSSDSADPSSQENNLPHIKIGKKPKMSPVGDYLSCPFRKRNPTKFNIREWTCATQPYSDLALLKRHIKEKHSRKGGVPQCPRCKAPFESVEELECHQRQTNPCQLKEIDDNNDDPEDGITSKMALKLAERKGEAKVSTYEDIWRTIFPRDEDDKIPDSSFDPPIELDELEYEFYNTDMGKSASNLESLNTRIRRMVLTVDSLLPESSRLQVFKEVESHLWQGFNNLRAPHNHTPFHARATRRDVVLKNVSSTYPAISALRPLSPAHLQIPVERAPSIRSSLSASSSIPSSSSSPIYRADDATIISCTNTQYSADQVLLTSEHDFHGPENPRGHQDNLDEYGGSPLEPHGTFLPDLNQPAPAMPSVPSRNAATFAPNQDSGAYEKQCGLCHGRGVVIVANDFMQRVVNGQLGQPFMGDNGFHESLYFDGIPTFHADSGVDQFGNIVVLQDLDLEPDAGVSRLQ